MKKKFLIFVIAVAVVFAIGSVIFFSGSLIRVQNDTGHDFAEVRIMNDSIGAIKSGATSQFVKVRAAYGDASVFTQEASGYFRNDRTMNPSGRLWSGRYTYLFRVDTNDMLVVTLRKD